MSARREGRGEERRALTRSKGGLRKAERNWAKVESGSGCAGESALTSHSYSTERTDEPKTTARSRCAPSERKSCSLTNAGGPSPPFLPPRSPSTIIDIAPTKHHAISLSLSLSLSRATTHRVFQSSHSTPEHRSSWRSAYRLERTAFLRCSPRVLRWGTRMRRRCSSIRLVRGSCWQPPPPVNPNSTQSYSS